LSRGLPHRWRRAEAVNFFVDPALDLYQSARDRQNSSASWCDMVASWILQDNLEPFLTTLSWVVSYSIDDDDWQAIRTDLLETDGDLLRWCSYEFGGNHQVRFRLAVDRGTEVMQVQVDAPIELEPQVALAVSIFQHFHLRKRRS
jgi:hypothetical protein